MMTPAKQNDTVLAMKKIAIAAIGFGVAAAGAGVYFGPGLYKQYKAKDAVSQMLRDPDSAQFRNVTVVGDVVCGQFNAKNGMGAMGGFEPFLVEGDSRPEFMPDLQVASDEELSEMKGECAADRERYLRLGSYGSYEEPYSCRRYAKAINDSIAGLEWTKSYINRCSGRPAVRADNAPVNKQDSKAG